MRKESSIIERIEKIFLANPEACQLVQNIDSRTMIFTRIFECQDRFICFVNIITDTIKCLVGVSDDKIAFIQKIEGEVVKKKEFTLNSCNFQFFFQKGRLIKFNMLGEDTEVSIRGRFDRALICTHACFSCKNSYVKMFVTNGSQWDEF